MYKLVLDGDRLKSSDFEEILVQTRGKLTEKSWGFEILMSEAMDKSRLMQLREELNCDVNQVPENFDLTTVKLVVSDMDSTLINIECVDEIADFAGVKAEVSRVTEQAMRGELDFAQSLTQRVKLLAGLEESALQKVYDERLRLNTGAEEMLQVLKNNNIKFALVSGGFTFFTDRLKSRLDLDYTLSNTLERIGGKLTGKIMGDIVGAEAKASFLLAKCRELNISPAQTVAIGDGANDLKMMSVAGLGVAYHAKPKVQEQADCALNHSGLDGLIKLLGLKD